MNEQQQQPNDKITVTGLDVFLRALITALTVLALLAYLKPPETPVELFGMYVCAFAVGGCVATWHAK